MGRRRTGRTGKGIAAADAAAAFGAVCSAVCASLPAVCFVVFVFVLMMAQSWPSHHVLIIVTLATRSPSLPCLGRKRAARADAAGDRRRAARARAARLLKDGCQRRDVTEPPTPNTTPALAQRCSQPSPPGGRGLHDRLRPVHCVGFTPEAATAVPAPAHARRHAGARDRPVPASFASHGRHAALTGGRVTG